MNRNPFSNEKYVMTNRDLENTLTRCKNCFKLTLNGSLIYHIKDLGQITLPTQTRNQHKYFIFVFVQPYNSTALHSKDSRHRKQTLGHWLSIACDIVTRNCLVIDAANNLDSYPNVIEQIDLFCRKNHLSWLPFGINFEGEGSKICGVTALYFCYQFTKLSLQGLIRLRSMMQSHDILHIENQIVKSVENHFKIVY